MKGNPALHVARVLLLGCAVFCVAHGTGYEVFEGGTCVRALYDDGSPMAFCDANVFAPGEDEEAYQAGTTDRNGCLAFVPDTNGTWRVVVDDGMGHSVRAPVDVKAGRMTGDARRLPMGRGPGMVIGLSLIVGGFGLYALVRQHAQRVGRRGVGGEC